jgi:flagellar protein FliO/FliZ
VINILRMRKSQGCVLVMLPMPALAAESTLGAGLQALVGLGIVLALIAACSLFLKRMTPGRFGRAGLLKPVATVAVGPRERIVVVELGDTWMVVGVTATQITALHTLPKETIPSTDPSTPTPELGASPFKRLLARIQDR